MRTVPDRGSQRGPQREGQTLVSEPRDGVVELQGVEEQVGRGLPGSRESTGGPHVWESNADYVGHQQSCGADLSPE